MSSDAHLHHDSFPHLRRSGSVFSSKGRVMVVGGTSCGTKEGDPEGRCVGGDESFSCSPKKKYLAFSLFLQKKTL